MDLQPFLLRILNFSLYFDYKLPSVIRFSLFIENFA